MKKRLVLILVIGICCACLFLYLINSKTDNNPSAGPLVKTVVVQPENTEAAYSDSLISQQVTAQNISGNPCYVRLKIVPAIINENGEKMDAEIGKQLILSDLNTIDWMDGGDGYFYYCEILQPGETAAQLYSQVAFSKTIDNTYAGVSVKIEANAEAVQAIGQSYRIWWEQVPESGNLKEIDNRLMNLG